MATRSPTSSNSAMPATNHLIAWDAPDYPLQDQELVSAETTVPCTTWGEWKEAHPDTTIVAEDGGIGRSYPLDPLDGRDGNGPIFPIGPAGGGGLRAVDAELGDPIPSHEAFWFAWSRFHPTTELWQA